MRLLHPRFCDEPGRALPKPGWRAGEPGHGPAGFVRQFVPLHWLPPHRGRGLQHAPTATGQPGQPGPAPATARLGHRRQTWRRCQARHQRLPGPAHLARAAGPAQTPPSRAAGGRLHRRGPVGDQAAPPVRAGDRHHPRGRTAPDRPLPPPHRHRRGSAAERGFCRFVPRPPAAAKFCRSLCRHAGAQRRHTGRQRGQRLAHW